MPDIAGASVWLEIDGVRLEEFGVERDESKMTVTCWVPCKTGKEFRFGVSLARPAPRKLRYRFTFSLDGTKIPSKALPKRSIQKTEVCTPGNPAYFEGQKEEEGLQPFQFASVRLTDDDSHMIDISNLGELVVGVYTYKDLKGEARKVKAGKEKVTTVSLGDTVVHERTKKGVTSCVQFGELRPLTPRSSANQMKGKMDRRMLVQGLTQVGTVVFKYRQIDVLVADGIAPRPVRAPAHDLPQQGLLPTAAAARLTATSRVAKAPAKNVKKEAIDLSLDEDDAEDEAQLQRLKARVAALQEMHDLNVQIEALESKKRARVREGSSQTAKRVKKEPKVVPFVPGEVIDLT